MMRRGTCLESVLRSGEVMIADYLLAFLYTLYSNASLDIVLLLICCANHLAFHSPK